MTARLSNDEPVTRHPLLRRPRGDAFDERASVLRRVGRMLSITHIGWRRVVLVQPADRPVRTSTPLRDVETVTLRPSCEDLAATLLTSVRPFYVGRGEC